MQWLAAAFCCFGVELLINTRRGGYFMLACRNFRRERPRMIKKNIKGKHGDLKQTAGRVLFIYLYIYI